MKQEFKFIQSVQERSIEKDNGDFPYVMYMGVFVIAIVVTCGLGGRFNHVLYII